MTTSCYIRGGSGWESDDVVGSESAVQLFAAQLRKRMDALKISNAEMARAVGVSRSIVTRWKDGTTGVTMDRLPLIADKLGCTVADLFGASQPPDPPPPDIERAMKVIADAVKKPRAKS